MMGFDYHGTPVEYKDDWLEVCKQQQVPYSKGKHTYLEAIQEAFPNLSKTAINRLFKDHAVKVYGYNCLPDENPEELYGPSFTVSVFKAGKARGFLFR